MDWHLCFRVDDVDAYAYRLLRDGVPLVSRSSTSFYVEVTRFERRSWCGGRDDEDGSRSPCHCPRCDIHFERGGGAVAVRQTTTTKTTTTAPIQTLPLLRALLFYRRCDNARRRDPKRSHATDPRRLVGPHLDRAVQLLPRDHLRDGPLRGRAAARARAAARSAPAAPARRRAARPRLILRVRAAGRVRRAARGHVRDGVRHGRRLQFDARLRRRPLRAAALGERDRRRCGSSRRTAVVARSG